MLHKSLRLSMRLDSLAYPPPGGSRALPARAPRKRYNSVIFYPFAALFASSFSTIRLTLPEGRRRLELTPAESHVANWSFRSVPVSWIVAFAEVFVDHETGLIHGKIADRICKLESRS
jgi:hypothetical protein